MSDDAVESDDAIEIDEVEYADEQIAVIWMLVRIAHAVESLAETAKADLERKDHALTRPD